MSETFDEAVGRSWERFETDLATRVRVSQAEAVTISVQTAGASEPHLRLALWDDEVALEVGTDVFLRDDDALDEVQRAALLALGWSAPDGVDHPTWWCDVELAELESVLSLVSSTLRGVFDVVDPVFLDVTPALGESLDDQDPDELVLGWPRTTEEMAELVTQVLTGVYGEGVRRDADGDFPIWTGTVPVWITPMGQRQALRFFSHVVIEVGNLAQARIEVEILNRRTPLLKFHLAGDVLIASYELPAHPFIGPMVMTTLDEVADTLDDLAQDLADRVGGRLFFDSVHESSDDEECR